MNTKKYFDIWFKMLKHISFFALFWKSVLKFLVVELAVDMKIVVGLSRDGDVAHVTAKDLKIIILLKINNLEFNPVAAASHPIS